MTTDPREELRALRDDLTPSPDQISALIDGSLETERDAPDTYALLDQLPSPSAAEVRALKRRVVEALDAPTATSRLAVVGVVGLIAAALAAAVLALS